MDGTEPARCFEVASKVIYQAYKEAEADDDMLIQVQKM